MWRRSEQESLKVVRAFLLNLFVAVPIYILFPVCDPRFALAGFPFNNPVIATPHPLAINAAPNGVPSVHTSSAFLILWFLKDWRLGQWFGWAFLCLTILATLGLGEHYALDLILAIPYAWAIEQFSRIVFYSEASIEERVGASAAG
jgi:membrane-associated phospholipid phosphatase